MEPYSDLNLPPPAPPDLGPGIIPSIGARSSTSNHPSGGSSSSSTLSPPTLTSWMSSPNALECSGSSSGSAHVNHAVESSSSTAAASGNPYSTSTVDVDAIKVGLFSGCWCEFLQKKYPLGPIFVLKINFEKYCFPKVCFCQMCNSPSQSFSQRGRYPTHVCRVSVLNY